MSALSPTRVDRASALQISQARAWLLAMRPATLWAAVAPVLVGSACAQFAGGFRPVPALAALLGALFIQIGTNFANDLFDFDKGADTAERLGPTRAVQAGLLSRAQMARGTALAFGLASVAGLYLVVIGGPWIAAIGIASIVSGIAYTGGPLPLGYLGLGDLFVFVFFGLVAVTATTFVQQGIVTELSWWAAVPVGTLATAILVVNNLRDRRTDREAGKRTLAVRWGSGFARAEYVLLIAVAVAVPPALWWRGLSAWVLLPLLLAPWATVLAVQVCRRDGRALNPCLGATARLMLAYCLLLALGLVLA